MKRNKYSDDGVDVGEEALFSKYASTICMASYKNSPFVQVKDLSAGNFRGPRPVSFVGLPKGFTIEATTDGIGTKGIVVDAAQAHRTAAYDLIPMTASDITRYGGVSLMFVNALDIVSVDKKGSTVSETYKKVLKGLGDAAAQARVVVLKGETAQMGVCVGSEITNSRTKINWSGTMLGAYTKDKMITGSTIAAGQVIIALKENGFRCNGISSVRKALAMKYGKTWWKNPKAKNSIRQSAAPSVLYDTYIATLNGWFSPSFKKELQIHAVVHLSGGAIREKLANDILFPKRLSAVLDTLWDPPRSMAEWARWRGMTDHEFYETWNGGQGMLLVVDKKDVLHCLKRAKNFGIKARVAGRIVAGTQSSVTVVSRLTKRKEVVYRPE